MNSKLFTFLVFLFFIPSMIFADSNGLWTNAEDVNPGTFGQDYTGVATGYTFIHPVVFCDPSGECTSTDDLGQWLKNPADSSEIYYSLGNVGVGTTNPQYLLDVRGPTNIDGSYFSNSSINLVTNSKTRIGISNTGVIRMGTNVNPVTVDVNGNLVSDYMYSQVYYDSDDSSLTYKLDLTGKSNFGGDLNVEGDLSIKGKIVSSNLAGVQCEAGKVMIGFDNNGNLLCVEAATPSNSTGGDTCIETWEPSASAVCAGVSYTQTNSCTGETQSATGTMSSCSYRWDYSAFGSCTASCGGGYRYRNVWCETTDNKVVADSYCSGTKPTTYITCNTQACTQSCTPSTWSPSASTVCSGTSFTQSNGCTTQTAYGTKDCSCTLDGITRQNGQGYNFFSTRNVPAGQSCSSYDQYRTCTDGSWSGISSYQYSSCSADSYTYSWQYGSWGSCSNTCGSGNQSRSAQCVRSDGVVVTSGCSGSPATTQSCQNYDTCTYSWDETYSQCTGDCGYNQGTHYRTYETCRRSDGTVVSDTSKCGPYPKSLTYESCTAKATCDNCNQVSPTINHGQTKTLYSRTSAFSPQCSYYSQQRTCTDGTLSGSSTYRYSSCFNEPMCGGQPC